MNSSASVSLRELEHRDLAEGAQLLGRAMCDNPANVRAFGGTDPARRGRALEHFFAAVLHGLKRRGFVYGAFQGDCMAGVFCFARPGQCQPSLTEKIRVAPAVALHNPPSAVVRVLRWTGEWARRDLSALHWHLGPVGVDPRFQQRGVGSAMLRLFCTHIDVYGGSAYLETDKRKNVEFYERFGFEVQQQADVLGVPNWFMTREPSSK